MIFYKTSSFGNDFIVIDEQELPPRADHGGLASAMPRRPQGASRDPLGEPPLGGLASARPRRPQGASRDPLGELPLGGLAREICDRQRGVGADGLVLFRRRGRGARFGIYNRDGGAAELSGNGMAGLAAVLLQRRLARPPLTLQAAIGRRRVALTGRQGPLFLLDVEIGVPDFAARGFFPFLRGAGGPYRAAGVEFHPVSVGNPHAVVMRRAMPGGERLAALGRRLEGHPMFPRRVNVEFVAPAGAGRWRVFFYERGVGPTQASSTGSAAVFAVLRRLGLACDEAALAAGDEEIHVSWRGGIHVRTRTRVVCRGEFFPRA